MSRRFQVVLSEEQYIFLDAEADRSSVSVAELIRRAIDTTYGIAGEERVQFIWHTLGRRSGRPFNRRSQTSPSQ